MRAAVTGANENSPVEDPLWASSKMIMRLQFLLLYDRPLSLRDLGLLTVASPQRVERSGRGACPSAPGDYAQVATLTRQAQKATRQ